MTFKKTDGSSGTHFLHLSRVLLCGMKRAVLVSFLEIKYAFIACIEQKIQDTEVRNETMPAFIYLIIAYG